MSLLDPEDVAYMRATQREAQPSAALLFRRTRTSDGKGGYTYAYPTTPDDVLPVRLNQAADQTSAGDVPENLAQKYQATDLTRVHADADGPRLRVHDRIRVLGVDHVIVSEAEPAAWTTAQIVWAVRE